MMLMNFYGIVIKYYEGFFIVGDLLGFTFFPLDRYDEAVVIYYCSGLETGENLPL